MRRFAFFGTIFLLAYSLGDARVFNTELNVEVERSPNRWWEQLLKIKATQANQFMHPPITPATIRLGENYLFPRWNSVKDKTTRVRRKTKDSNAIINALAKSPHPIVYQPKMKDQIPQLHDVLREVWKMLFPNHPDLHYDTMDVKMNSQKANNIDALKAQHPHVENNHFHGINNRSKDAQRNSGPGDIKERVPKVDDHMKWKPSTHFEDDFAKLHDQIGLHDHDPKLPAIITRTNHRNNSFPDDVKLPTLREKDFRFHEDLAAPLLKIYPDDVPVPLLHLNETNLKAALQTGLFNNNHHHQKEIIANDNPKISIHGVNSHKIENLDSGRIEQELRMPPITKDHNDEEKHLLVHESPSDVSREVINLRKSNLAEHLGKSASDFSPPSLRDKSPVSNNPFSYKIPIVPRYPNTNPAGSTLTSRSRQILRDRKNRNNQNSASVKVNNLSQLRNHASRERNAAEEKYSSKMKVKNNQNSASLGANSVSKLQNTLPLKKDSANDEYSLADMMGVYRREVGNLSQLNVPLPSKIIDANDKYSSEISTDMMGKNIQNSVSLELGNISHGPLPNDKFSSQILADMMGRNGPNSVSLEAGNLSQLPVHAPLPSKIIDANDKYSSQISTDMMGKNIQNSLSLELGNISQLHGPLPSKIINANDKHSSQISTDIMGKNIQNSASLEVGNLSQLHGVLSSNRVNANDNYSSKVLTDMMGKNGNNSASLEDGNLSQLHDRLPLRRNNASDMMGKNSASLEVGTLSQLHDRLPLKRINANNKISRDMMGKNSASLEVGNLSQLHKKIINANDRYSQILPDKMGKNKQNSESLEMNKISQLRKHLQSKRINANDKYSSKMTPDIMGISSQNSASLRNPLSQKIINANDKYSSQFLPDMMGKNSQNSASLQVNNLSKLQGRLPQKNVNTFALPDMTGKNSPNTELLDVGDLSQLIGTLPPGKVNPDDKYSSQILQDETGKNTRNSFSLKANNLSQLRDPSSPKIINANENYSSLIPKAPLRTSLPKVNNNHLNPLRPKIIDANDDYSSLIPKAPLRTSLPKVNNNHLDPLRPKIIDANDDYSSLIPDAKDDYSSLIPKTPLRTSLPKQNNKRFGSLASKKMDVNDDYSSLIPKTHVRTSLPNVNKYNRFDPLAPKITDANDKSLMPKTQLKTSPIVNNNRLSKNTDYSDFSENMPISTLRDNNFGQNISRDRKSGDKSRQNNFVQNLAEKSDDLEAAMNVSKMSMKEVFEIVSKEHGYDKNNPNFNDLRDNWERILRLSGIIHNQEMPSYIEPEYERLKAFYVLGHQNALYLSRNLDKILNDTSSKLLETPMAQNGVRYAQFFGSGSLNPVTNNWMYKNRRKNLPVDV